MITDRTVPATGGADDDPRVTRCLCWVSLASLHSPLL